MAYGEFKISGDDVYEALTRYDKNYNRVLSEEGDKLADLIVERLLSVLASKLLRKPDDE